MRNTLFILFIFYSTSSFGQATISFENQFYKLGHSPSINFSISVKKNFNVTSRFGYDLLDSYSDRYSSFDRGGGPRFGVSFERDNLFLKNFSVFVSTDVLFIKRDWTTLGGFCAVGKPADGWPDHYLGGEVRYTNIQPSFGFGYSLSVFKKYFVKPTISLGLQNNIYHSTGRFFDGTVFLTGIQIGTSLKRSM